MMMLLRIAVVAVGAGFLLIGVAVMFGPGFPISERPPRPVSELSVQATLAFAYGAALVAAGVFSNLTTLLRRCLIMTLLFAPFLLWLMSSGAAKPTKSFPIVVFYVSVTLSGIAVLARRRDA